jgi:membrane fusion protein (multidrug efflux system)
MADENNNSVQTPTDDHHALPPPPRRRVKPRSLVIIAAVVLVVAAASIYYVLFVRPYESTDDAFVDGYVTLLSARVPGQVQRLLVTDNQAVKQGDILVQLDPSDYQAGVAQAEAELVAAQGQLAQARAQMAVSTARVSQAQAATASAAAAEQRAQDDLKRYESVEQRAVSKTALDQAQTQARTASADLRASNSQLKASEAAVTLSKAGVDSATASVKVVQAKLKLAQLNLTYTQVAAPVDARVTARSVQTGNFVQPGQALLALVPKIVWVTANFKETQLTDMRRGQPVELRIDAYPHRTFKGHIDSLQAGTGARFSLLPPENAVGNYVKVVQRVPVKIVFDEAPPEGFDIAPGMSVVPTVKVR